MNNKPLIITVDDEAPVRDVITKALSCDFEVEYAASGDQCFDLLDRRSPQTIFLDVKMPKMNGLEVCRRIRSEQTTKDIPIIFLSALDSIKERLAAYEAGGDDFIAKPFQVSELRKKAHISVANHEKITSLAQHSSFATETAMQAMTTSGELGVVLGFFRNSFICHDYQALASALCDALSAYGLNSTIQIVTDKGNQINTDTSGVVRPLESNLLEKLRHKQRIFDFGSRTVFNYPSISVLIKNMPLEDEAKYGRYKDNLAIIVEGASARIEALNTAVALDHQNAALESLLARIKNALGEIQKTHNSHKLASDSIVNNLMDNLEESFLTAGLTEEQENTFMALVEGSAAEMIELYERGLSINEKFADIFHDIEKAPTQAKPEDQ